MRDELSIRALTLVVLELRNIRYRTIDVRYSGAGCGRVLAPVGESRFTRIVSEPAIGVRRYLAEVTLGVRPVHEDTEPAVGGNGGEHSADLGRYRVSSLDGTVVKCGNVGDYGPLGEIERASRPDIDRRTHAAGRHIRSRCFVDVDAGYRLGCDLGEVECAALRC